MNQADYDKARVRVALEQLKQEAKQGPQPAKVSTDKIKVKIERPR